MARANEPVTTSLATLREALGTGALVRVERTVESGHVTGRVAALTSRLVALAVFADDMRPNGFEVVRRVDLRRVRLDPYPAFHARALSARGLRLPRLGGIRVTSFREAIADAARRFPLVAVHRERIRRGACLIGRPYPNSAERFSLLTVDPDATWDPVPVQLLYRDVTRVDFGGGYEEALHLVAGPPPRA